MISWHQHRPSPPRPESRSFSPSIRSWTLLFWHKQRVYLPSKSTGIRTGGGTDESEITKWLWGHQGHLPGLFFCYSDWEVLSAPSSETNWEAEIIWHKVGQKLSVFYKTIPHIFKGESLLGVFGIEEFLRLSTHSMRDLQSNDCFFFLGTSTFFVPVNMLSFYFLSFPFF